MNIVESFYQSVIYDGRWKFILEGLKNTCLIALGAVVLGVIIGSIIVDKIRIKIFKLLGIFEYTNNIQNKIYKLKEKHIKI